MGNRGGSRPKLKGGATWRGGAKDTMESERAEGARKFLGTFRENSLVFLQNNVFSPHSERITEKRVHLLQDKGRFSCQKGGAKAEFSS